MNFTWFASAYDNDDALYRALTLIIMVGALLADGDQIEVSNAREFWFIPAPDHQPPPRWKQACVTFLVIMPLSLI